MVTPAARAADAERRVVLLGASNLTRACHTVLQIARHTWGGPLDVLAAWGRGRSYGWRSGFLGRELPGIATCGLWNAVARRRPLPLAALITDIGNDLLYGAEVDEIATWVEACLARLNDAGATIVMTRMPMRNIESLSPRRFDFFRRLLFPGKRIDLDTVVANARALDAKLQALGRRYGAAIVEQRTEWYAFDPIHLKMSSWRRAWSEILAPWNRAARQSKPTRTSFTHWLRLHALSQEERTVLGRNYRRAQPVARLHGDIVLSLYRCAAGCGLKRADVCYDCPGEIPSKARHLAMSEIVVRCRPNGPFVIEGTVKVIDQHGNAFVPISDKPATALCRCGQSNHKPFCDGSHKTCGFVAEEIAPSA